jgi:hypothetical protein
MKQKPGASPLEWAIVAAMLLLLAAVNRPTPVF